MSPLLVRCHSPSNKMMIANIENVDKRRHRHIEGIDSLVT